MASKNSSRELTRFKQLVALILLVATTVSCSFTGAFAQQSEVPTQDAESVEVIAPVEAQSAAQTVQPAARSKQLSQAMPLVPQAAPLVPQTAQTAPPVEAQSAQPSAQSAPGQKPAAMPMLKGQVTYCLPMGTPVKLKLATVPLYKMNLMNRGLDGELLPAQVNMPITAKVSEDIYVDNNKVIPEGTVFEGRVTKIFPPRRNGRNGSCAMEFNTFRTPDGRRFAFHVDANNTLKSTFKTKARGAGRLAAHAAGGAIVGALIAYQLFGMQATIAMHGYNVAGGAAAGALAGLGISWYNKGKKAVLEPGEDLNMQFDSDLLIPAASAPTVKKAPPALKGLEMQILKQKLIKDGLDGYQLRIKALVLNETGRELRSMDLFMVDDLGKRHSVVSDGDEKAEVIFHIEPDSMREIYFSFNVEYPKLKRKLVWVDPMTRRVIHEERLP